MSKLLIKGGHIITPTEQRITDLLVDGNRIAAIGPCSEAQTIEVDARDCYVTPGLFDIQVNGGPGCDFWAELNWESIGSFSQSLLSSGVTSILPTLITGDMARLKSNRDFLKEQLGLPGKRSSEEKPLVRMPGIHFEGPCLSPKKPGVHPVQHLKPLEKEVLQELVDENTKLITMACELDPDGNCVRYLAEKNVAVSLGHSNATFEEAQQAFAQGVKIMTHTFNALPPLHHREPGAVGAALLDKNVHCCVIPDGLHVAPPMVQLLLQMKGIEHTVLVTDIAAIGTSQGGLVGSSLVLDDGVRNIVKWQIASFAEAVRMASYNPACLLGLSDLIGNITPGAFADIVIWDRKTLQIKNVIFDGKILNREPARALVV